MFRQTLFVPTKPEIQTGLTVKTTPQLLALQHAYSDKINFLVRYLRFLRPSAFAICVLLIANSIFGRGTPRQRALSALGGLVFLERCHSRLRSLRRHREERQLVEAELAVRDLRRGQPF